MRDPRIAERIARRRVAKLNVAPIPQLPTSQRLYLRVLKALQEAEEVGGPEEEEYVRFMQGIEQEARTRRENYEY